MATIMGVAINAPTIPQSCDQKSKLITIKIVLMFNFCHIILGSTKFQVITCGISKHKSNKNDVPMLSKTTNEYKNGNHSAIKAQTMGTKSIIKTISQNVNAKGNQNKVIITVATTAFIEARKNFAEK